MLNAYSTEAFHLGVGPYKTSPIHAGMTASVVTAEVLVKQPCLSHDVTEAHRLYTLQLGRTTDCFSPLVVCKPPSSTMKEALRGRFPPRSDPVSRVCVIFNNRTSRE